MKPGLLPFDEALAALLARLGTSDPVEPVTDMAPLIAGIDFARFGRAPSLIRRPATS